MTLQSLQDQHLHYKKLNRKSRRVYDFSVATLRQYSHMRQDDAAKELGVAPITLKRICQRRSYRWPYRSVKAAEKRRERQRAASIAAAIASISAVSPAIYVSSSKTPTPSSSPSPQHALSAPSFTHHNHRLLSRQFPLDNTSSPMELSTWRSRAASPTNLTDSPPSSAVTMPARHPMSPRRDKRTSFPMPGLSLNYSSYFTMSRASTRLPPLRVALHPNYVAMRQHEQRASAELRLRYTN